MKSTEPPTPAPTHTQTINKRSTTSTPSLAQRIHAQAAKQGVSSVDAPVSGGDVGARNAALSFMIGGDQPTVEALRPLFDVMGKNVRFMGGAGCGQHTKMVNQILIATNMIGVVEGLLYAQKVTDTFDEWVDVFFVVHFT